jgi:glyoxylase-like metal-dependent hydrolase (beta-lactamase superfamily II)
MPPDGIPRLAQRGELPEAMILYMGGKTVEESKRRGLMKRWALVLFVGVAASFAGVWFPGFGQVPAVRPPAGTLHKGSAFRFNKITDDVYHVVGTGTMSIGSNSAVIINENEVVIVDSHITPAAAWVLMEELKAITSKPVKYVVNSHFHFDHAHGNQILGRDVEVIGHEFTRQMLSNPKAIFDSATYRGFTSNVPAQIDDLKRRIAASTDAAQRSQLQDQLQVQESYQAALADVKPTPPTMTVGTKTTLYRGGREIQLMFLGRGHTGGDVVTLLPRERIVVTGDLLVNGLAYMGDAYVDEWINTLEELKKLDFATVLPGHGAAFTDRQQIDHFQAYLRDFWSKTSEFKRQGVPAEQAAQRIDMTNHKGNFASIQAPGVDVRAMQRAYARLDELARQ